MGLVPPKLQVGFAFRGPACPKPAEIRTSAKSQAQIYQLMNPCFTTRGDKVVIMANVHSRERRIRIRDQERDREGDLARDREGEV